MKQHMKHTGSPAAKFEAKRAQHKAQASAKHKRNKKRKQVKARNEAAGESAGAQHSRAALFHTPHTPGQVHSNNDDAHSKPQDAMSSGAERGGEREREGSAVDRYSSPGLTVSDSQDREMQRLGKAVEVRHAVRTDGELAFLIAGTLCDGHAACAQLPVEHPFFPSLSSHIQLICRNVAAGHAQENSALLQKLSAQNGEQDAQLRTLKDQHAAVCRGLKQLEQEYAAFQQRVHRNLMDKAAAIDGLLQTADSLRLSGTPLSTMKQLLAELSADMRAGFQQELTSLETKLATAGVQFHKADLEDEGEMEDEHEDGEAYEQQQPSTSQPLPPKQFAVSGSQNLAKHMPKPAPYSGSEDVDEALFTFESYLSATGADMSAWRVKQMDRPVAEYVRRLRSLIASMGSAPPIQQDQTVALFDGLNPALQQKAAVDPHTGTFWQSFDALAHYLNCLETQTPKPVTRTPAFGPKATAKKAKLNAVAAPQDNKRARKEHGNQQGGQQGGGRQGGGGGRGGGRSGGKGGGQSKQRNDQGGGVTVDPARYKAFLAYEMQNAKGN